MRSGARIVVCLVKKQRQDYRMVEELCTQENRLETIFNIPKRFSSVAGCAYVDTPSALPSLGMLATASCCNLDITLNPIPIQ